MQLHEDKKTFLAAVRATAVYHKIDPAIIEKDYYVTIFLEKLAQKLPTLLFKGGTSLSKCHKIINRFSEDIDLTLFQDTVTQGQKKKLKATIKEVCDELGLELLNEDETRSRRNYNRYEINYSPELPVSAIKPILLVETVFIVKAYPAEEKPATSLIYDYLKATNRTDIAEKYNLLPYPVLVQTLDRTLIDKIFALCDYYLTDNLKSHSRHIYDISKLLDKIDLDNGFTDLFSQVRKSRREGSSQCVSADEKYDINTIILEIINKEIYKKDYNEITQNILYEDISYDQAISALQKLVSYNLF